MEQIGQADQGRRLQGVGFIPTLQGTTWFKWPGTIGKDQDAVVVVAGRRLGSGSEEMPPA